MVSPAPPAIRQRIIDPMVDFAFKRLLGSEQNKEILILFLNAVLHRSGEHRIVEVSLINPYNDKDFADDKLTVVDVKAKDLQGHVFQVEVQLRAHKFLTERMLYTWSQVYSKQVVEGDKYSQLKPVTSIWLLRETVFSGAASYAHRARMQDPQTGIVLDKDSSIHILEVEKWAEQGEVLDSRDEWLKFFWEGRMMELETLSQRLSPEFGPALDVLRSIREQEEDYYRYLSRLDYQRTQATIKAEAQEERELRVAAEQALEAERQESARKDQALSEQQQALEAERLENARKEQALSEKEQALLEQQQALEAERIERQRLHEMLLKAGIQP